MTNMLTFNEFVRDTWAWHVIRAVTRAKYPAFQYFDERHPLIRQRYTERSYDRSNSGVSQASRHTEVRGFSLDSEKADNDFLNQTISRTTWEKYGIENRRGLHLVEFLPNDPEVQKYSLSSIHHLTPELKHDEQNPRNWCVLKKAIVSFHVCLLVIAVYAGASIYTVGTHGVREQFGVSEVVALLGLTVFVLGYGLGPMVWGPLSEIPQIGRNLIYIPALAVFGLAQIPIALATSIGMLFGFRFLAGFFGSPVLGSGGGILIDMYASRKHTYALASFSLIGICGPTIGPIVGGFAVELKGWAWSAWIVSWLAAWTLAVLIFFLPETSADNILYRRAMRLRKVTGDSGFVCEAQLRADYTSGTEVFKAHLVRPFTLFLTEPAVFFLNLYSAFTYGLMYIWFEAFPLAYGEVYHFGTGKQRIALLGLIVGVLLTIPPFFLYYRKRIEPHFDRDGNIEPEKHLHPAMVGCLFIPASLVWFGWTARPSISYLVPIVGSSLFTAGGLLLYMSILNYLTESYPDHVSSVLAGNELFNSICGATFPLLIPPMYYKFGVLGSSMILAIFAVAFVPLPFILYMRGARLRKQSSYARKGM
ncbi:major facilitator superfamily transporter [Colletotrichum orchidophilum]|uniref:Major facilitator superfamily transporter n=1 Tax=Colletotrichum orchidophilum TaxID=1209926 RepID=A0A1G4ATN7_9PEZI|nr:major facilitator superfamily transporter [Colletotrichum orchidophilum]OHE92539.1 major facilitator superfamily transporter [Colletotrichum orchidophilum]